MKQEHSSTWHDRKNQTRFALWGMAAACLLADVSEAQDPSYWRNGGAVSGGIVSLKGIKPSALQQNAPVTNTTVVPQGGGAMAAMAMQVSESMDAEVTALAKALGEGQAAPGEGRTAKALRIFNWVRNNVEYDCYHGLRKGAELTLLEGSGNDMDQCALLIKLRSRAHV